jgi:DNA-binding protein H-NS
MQERMEAHQREIKEIIENIMNSNHNETLACRKTTEERLGEKKPTSPDRKPEAAQKTEVPTENTTVIPV